MSVLPFSRYQAVPLAHVRADGWILEFLRRQCAGISGNPQASGYPFDHAFWGRPNQSPDVLDPAMVWWPYEQTAYRLDGALKAGFFSGDKKVYQMALEEIDQALAQTAPDGFIGPEIFRDHNRWPYVIFFRAVLAQYAISGERRYLDALLRHYRSTPHPMGFGRDVSGAEILLLLYAETGEADLLAMAQDLYERFNRQAGEMDGDTSLAGMLSDKPVRMHGVTFNELAKLGAMFYAASGMREGLEATLNAYAKVERDHLLADGLHSGAEGMSGHGALESHESCNISDYTWSLGYLLQISGDARFGDQIERVIFNALPGSILKDFKALQYFSCPNQVVATRTSNHNPMSRGDNRMTFRPGHPVQCCTGNIQRAMPNYTARMWMRGGDGQGAEEIAAALYGPGRLETSVSGVALSIEAQTGYPFEEGVRFTLRPAQAVRFTFSLRIPAWCRRASIAINGQALAGDFTPGSFTRITREWQMGDLVTLSLPYELALKRWPAGGVSLEYGPLTLSLAVDSELQIDREDDWEQTPQEFRLSGPQPVQEGFPRYSLSPSSSWAYALALDETTLGRADIRWSGAQGYPLDLQNPALRVRVPARRLRGWTLVESGEVWRHLPSFKDGKFRMLEGPVKGHFILTPPLPEADSLPERLGAEEWIELVPYANTLLRLTVFPDGTRG